VDGRSTKHRATTAATVAFASKGVAGTSLDGLAGELGVTKQSILYHFGSKEGLLAEVLETAAYDLLEVLDQVTAASPPGWDRVEATVRAMFALAVRRPELLGLLREVNRLGPPYSRPIIAVLQPTVDSAIGHLEQAMLNDTFRRSDPRLVLVSAYAVVTGAVGDVEVLRAVGLEVDIRLAVQVRRTVLGFLRAALLAQ